MDKLEAKDLDEIFNFMQYCVAFLKTTDEFACLLSETQKAFNSDELVFLCPNPVADGIDLEHSFSLQRGKSFLARYANYFWRYDPLYQAEFSPESNTLAFRTEDILPYTQFFKLKYYYDFFQPQNLHSELVIRLCFQSHLLGAISLLRSKERPIFDTKDIQKAELIIPYIVNAMNMADISSKSNAEQILFEQWLESQSEGIILLDSDFQLLFCNSRAKLFCWLLSGNKAYELIGPELKRLVIPDIIKQDCKHAKKFCRGEESLREYESRIVNAENKKRYHIQYFAFASTSSESIRPRFIIVINDLSRYVDDTEEIFLSQVKLSRKEAEIAEYASMGLTNKEIADCIQSSPYTIQNHLKKVFEKTGLKNRTQLANLMKYSGSSFT